MKQLLFLFFLLVAVSSCGPFTPDQYTQGSFPETPENLSDINSADDDYNSTSHVVGNVMALVFSSKRGGRTDFNLVHESLETTFDLRSGSFTFNTHPYGGLDVIEEQSPLTWAAQVANSNANELGPYIRSFRDLAGNTTDSDGHFGEYLMLFASDRSGNLDIYFTHNYQSSPTSVTGLSSRVSNKQFVAPQPVAFLNSPADDGYPTFDKGYQALYFTSNRGGNFDIYKAGLPAIAPSAWPAQLPTLTNISIEKVASLSSSADDKCPFISGDRLVFSSNRPGGYGGYDLYFSDWTAEGWSAPVNFGPGINTSSDEYRPILYTSNQFTNQLMIFSSNRPGGKGGFDLYRVGIPVRRP
ncbi:TolB family protein [Spirosoma flavus]